MSLTFISLILYLIFLFAFAIFSAFALYHLWQFGFLGDLCKPVAIVYLTCSGVIIFFSFVLILGLFLRG